MKTLNGVRFDPERVHRRLVAGSLITAGCYLWQGAVTAEGYPRLTFRTVTRDGADRFRKLYAHRLAWAMFKPGVPPVEIRHRCGNRRCWNPEHLIERK